MASADRPGGLAAAVSVDFVHRFEPSANGRTLLLLHGTGGTEDDLLGWASFLDPEGGILSPRGKVLESGMPRFFKRFADGSFDLDDLRVRVNELADFLLEAAKEYRIVLDQLVAVGYSNGANAAASLLLLRPETLSGAVLFRAQMPIVPESPPALTGKRVLSLGGRLDPYATVESVERLHDALQSCGADVETLWHDGGHEVARAELEAARTWLDDRT